MVHVTENASEFQGKSKFPASSRIYVVGSRPGIRVPFRRVTPDPTTGRFGQEENTPMQLYDTSGPYTDSSVSINLKHGLPSVRRERVLEKGEVEEYNIQAKGKSIAQLFPRLKSGTLLSHVRS